MTPHEDPSSHSRFRIVAALAGLFILGGIVWIGAQYFFSDSDEVVIIRADNTPFKVKPDQPGGMEIPHQDKLVFNSVSPDGKPVTVERLLPPPEQPLVAQADVAAAVPPVAAPPPSAPASAPAVVAPENPVAMGRAVETVAEVQAKTIDAPVNLAQERVVATPAFDMAKAEKKVEEKTLQKLAERQAVKEDKEPSKKAEAAKKAETPKAAPQAAVITATVSEPTSAQDTGAGEEGAEEESAPAEVPAAKPAESGGKASFQLASFYDRPSAEKAIQQFKTKHAASLGGVSLFVVEAEAKGKRVYRVQGSAVNAGQVCGGVKAEGGTCVLIRP